MINKLLSKFRNGILLGLIALSACKPTNQDSSTLKERLDYFNRENSNAVQSFSNSYSTAYRTLRLSTNDGVFSTNEQSQVFSNLSRAYSSWTNHNQLFKTYALESAPRLFWSQSDSNLLFLLDKNLNGFDANKPELQKYWESKGNKVNVEGVFSLKEQKTAETAVEIGTTVIESILDAISE